MPSLKAWLEGTGAPAHRQVVQGPALNRLSKSGEACVANVVVVQPQLLCIKQMFCVRRVHMPSLKAWLQGTGAPAHLQLVQRPTD